MLNPTKRRLICKPLPKTEQVGGVYIPEDGAKLHMWRHATVLRVGPDEDQIKPGDVIRHDQLLGQYYDDPVEGRLLIIDGSSVPVVVEGEIEPTLGRIKELSDAD